MEAPVDLRSIGFALAVMDEGCVSEIAFPPVVESQRPREVLTEGPMANISDIIDDLKEARRYVRSNSDSAICFILEVRRELIGLRSSSFLYGRLDDNMVVAMSYMQVAPDVAIGYIDGAVFELELALGKPKEDES